MFKNNEMNGLKRIATAIDHVNDWIGRCLAWLTLGMVLSPYPTGRRLLQLPIF